MTAVLQHGPALPRISRAGLAFVVAAHGAALYALLQMNVIRLPLALPVLEVSLLTPSVPEPVKPETVPPRPRPVEQRPRPRPAPEVAPLALPAETPVAASPVEAPAAVSPPAPASAPPAPPAPSQPRFDADYLDNPKPAYPALSRKLKEEGRVVLRVQVAANGLPSGVDLHAGSGYERLDRLALETVRRWKFVPARLGNEPVAASVLVPIVFSLKD